MKNIFMNDRSVFTVNNIFENDIKYPVAKSSKTINSNLDDLRLLVLDGLLRVKLFILNSYGDKLNQDAVELNNLIEEYKNTNEWFKNNGVYIFYHITDTVNSKWLRKEQIIQFIQILDNHFEIAHELICKNVTYKRAERILKYINELPFYLKTDLSMDQNICSNERKIITTSFGREDYKFKQEMNEETIGYKLAI